MSTKLVLATRLDQRLVMSQQLRQAITLLQYNTLDLKQLVQHHLENNPLIETEENEPNENESIHVLSDNPQDQPQLTNYSADFYKNKQYQDDENKLENYSIPESLREHLLEQILLCGFDKTQHKIAEAIIDAIDENGRLTMSLEDIRQTIPSQSQASTEQMNDVLKKIQTLDPTGVGARNIQECLLIQLDCLTQKDKTHDLAVNLVCHYFEMLASNNTKKIIKALGVSTQEFADAMALLRTLNPTPGVRFSSELDTDIEPELYVKKIKNDWRVFLTRSVLTKVRLNTQYRDLIKKNKNQNNEPLNLVLQEAQGLIKGLKRRNETLLTVATHIIELQKDFLEIGATSMKPLNIIDVSHALNLHESTVSRITTGKYISTPRGVFELKYFFPSHVQTQTGGECSAVAVKALIKDIISHESEDHILSDGEIAILLKQKGINIARRTVAKYREAMKILPSFQRAQMVICCST